MADVNMEDVKIITLLVKLCILMSSGHVTLISMNHSLRVYSFVNPVVKFSFWQVETDN